MAKNKKHDQDRLISTREIIKEFRVTLRFVRHWTHSGRIRPKAKYDGENVYQYSEVKAILDNLRKPLPDNYVTIAEVAKRLGISRKMVGTRARSMKLQMETFRPNGAPVQCLRVSDLPKLSVPEGKMCVSVACSHFGVKATTVYAWIKSGQLPATKMRQGPLEIALLDPEDVRKMAESFKQQKVAPVEEVEVEPVDYCRAAAEAPGYSLAPHDVVELQRRRERYDSFCRERASRSGGS